MSKSNTKEKTYPLKISLKGELMEGGSVEYETLFGVVGGTAGSLERLSKLLKYDNPITFYVSPPKEKCFEIILQVSEMVGAIAPLFSQSPSVKNVVEILIEYLKIKKSLKGEKLTSDMIQESENGKVVVNNKKGNLIYNDDKNIVNINIITTAASDPHFNKSIEKTVKALDQSERADEFILGEKSNSNESNVSINKEDSAFFEYEEEIKEESKSIAGFIRQINNSTHKGLIVIEEEGKKRTVYFELDIKDIKVLDKTVRSLAIAEGTGQRVVLSGEFYKDSHGKIKKIMVNEAHIPDLPLNFGN